jgi:hypothetical protein
MAGEALERLDPARHAGEDRDKASAAALTEPRRATWTKASIAVSGGYLRMEALLLCAATRDRGV